ncbi:MAG: BamA/TamA family outer membrane protein [Pontixanthobacter sp.]
MRFASPNCLKRELTGARLRCGLSVVAIAVANLSAQTVYAQDTGAGVANANDPETVIADVDPLTTRTISVPPPPPGADLPLVEPIITDSEFDEAIPDLGEDDPELMRDIESIAEFERRFAEAEAEAAAEALAEARRETGEDGDTAVAQADGTVVAPDPDAPLGLPELADGDISEEIGDAPIRDAELLAPLSPIEEFEVNEAEFAANDVPDDDAVTVEYDVVVNGLDTIEGQTEFDLAATFNDLSALENSGDDVANVAMLSARVEEDSALLKRLLESEGWYGAAVTSRIERTDGVDNGQPLTAIIDAAPGERYTFADINIEAGPTTPPDLIADNFAIEVGEPIVAARVQGAEAQVAIALPRQGYPFVEVGQRDILLDAATADGVYTLPIATGPLSRFGGFTTTGDLAFDAEHVGVLARFERGELYDSRKVDDLRDALIATGLFNTVTVQPEQTGEPADGIAADGSEFVNIAVTQNAGPARTLAGSAGFGTGQGFRLEGSWSHRNLFPPEGALIGNIVLGTQEQGAGVTFRRSNAGRRDRTFEVGLNALRADYDAFEALTGRLYTVLSYSSTPIWQKRFTYAVGAEILGSIEEDFDFAIGENVDRTYFIGALTGQVGFDTTDSLLNPTEGFRLTARVQPEGSLQDGFTPYVRGVVEGSTYLPFGDSFVLAGRAKVGTIQGVDRVDIAPSRRFYAGGGGSVRGFGFQQLGPQVLEPNPNFNPDDPEEQADPFRLRPIGGLSLNEAAVELRYRFGNFGVVGFVDAGQVYEGSNPEFNDIRFGAGIGGRYYTNFGPLRVDIATPIGRRENESLINLYISIGQAF